MKIAFLYLTNKNSKCLFNLQTLIKHINLYKEHQIDLYIYNNNEELNDIIYNDNYCEFSFNKLQEKLNYSYKFDTFLFMGNCHLQLIDLYLNHKDYDRFISYEDDLTYIGNNNLFELIDFSKDIIFSNKRLINYEWYWYNKNLHNLNLKPYCELLNICVFSGDVIQKIYNFMNEGNFAHQEYLINSYIMENYEKYNWQIGYLKGNNEFCLNQKEFLYTANGFVHPIKNIHQLLLYKKQQHK